MVIFLSSPFFLLSQLLTHFADAFPSSEAFDVINSALTASDVERKDAIKQGNAVFAFTLKNKAGETESWHIDLQSKGEVGKGLGEKPTGKQGFYRMSQAELQIRPATRARSTRPPPYLPTLGADIVAAQLPCHCQTKILESLSAERQMRKGYLCQEN
jgi:hypothetical protein